ncbi:MAG: helix-turn-helix domain-containing protein [Lachnospiraceae bacterium]|nr:helix-turn-helix domain-containing protein [Lachnospiraceae bacterium]
MQELNFHKIGAKIRERRLALGYTQDYLANYLDIDSSHISNVEHGRCKVSLTAIVGIANALDCSIDYFLSSEYNNETVPVDSEIMNKLKQCDLEKKKQISRIIDAL